MEFILFIIIIAVLEKLMNGSSIPEGRTFDRYTNEYIQPSDYEIEQANELSQNSHKSGQYMSATAKLAYMRSSKWQNLKNQRLRLANHTCESPNCSNTADLHLHHIDYSNLGSEFISDVRVLCKSCHQTQHDHYGYSRSTSYYPLV